jgi:hypothetical protein
MINIETVYRKIEFRMLQAQAKIPGSQKYFGEAPLSQQLRIMTLAFWEMMLIKQMLVDHQKIAALRQQPKLETWRDRPGML